LAVESNRVHERPKGGQPYRRRPPITNPSDAYLDALEHQRNIDKFEQLKLDAARKAEIAEARLTEGLEAALIAAEADELGEFDELDELGEPYEPDGLDDAATGISGRQ